MKNALIKVLKFEMMEKLSIQEKGEIVRKLKAETKNTYRELEKLTGIPHSTLLDWATGRQSNKGKNIHISFSAFYTKISNMTPKDITDWGRLEMIKEVLEKLLEKRNEYMKE